MSCRATPLGGGTSGDHTFKCGVSFELPHSLRRHGSFRRVRRRWAKPWGESPGIRCRLPEAGRSGIHALHGTRPCCHAAAGCSLGCRFLRAPPPWDGLPGILDAAGRWPPVADHTLARLPRAASVAGFQPAVLVRESNPRQPDPWSGALSTELTWLTRPSVRTHVRNARCRPPR